MSYSELALKNESNFSEKYVSSKSYLGETTGQWGKKQDSRDSRSRLGVPRESLESLRSPGSPSGVPGISQEYPESLRSLGSRARRVQDFSDPDFESHS